VAAVVTSAETQNPVPQSSVTVSFTAAEPGVLGGEDGAEGVALVDELVEGLADGLEGLEDGLADGDADGLALEVPPKLTSLHA